MASVFIMIVPRQRSETWGRDGVDKDRPQRQHNPSHRHDTATIKRRQRGAEGEGAPPPPPHPKGQKPRDALPMTPAGEEHPTPGPA